MSTRCIQFFWCGILSVARYLNAAAAAGLVVLGWFGGRVYSPQSYKSIITFRDVLFFSHERCFKVPYSPLPHFRTVLLIYIIVCPRAGWNVEQQPRLPGRKRRAIRRLFFGFNRFHCVQNNWNFDLCITQLVLNTSICKYFIIFRTFKES